MKAALLALMLALVILAAPLAADAQRAGKVPRIGFLGPTARSDPYYDVFRQALRELGYVEGQNILLEDRWAEGRIERLPNLMAELLRLEVDVVVAASTPGAVAAKNATRTIPIVFVGAGDAVGLGIVPNLRRPGGNVTGFSLALGERFSGKWLELLKETVPKLSRVAVLWNPAEQFTKPFWEEMKVAAPALRVRLQSVEVRDPTQFEGVFAAIASEQTQALIVVTDPLTYRYRERIVALAAEHRLPAMYGFREFMDAGGLMAYGPSIPDLFRRAAPYVDKILKGAKPGDLPVEQPTRFELLINLKTAKALGLTIPQSLLLRADEVIR